MCNTASAEGCPRAEPPPPRAGRANGVRIGVGNRAGRDFDMEVYDNDVIGGRGRMRLGVGNRAGRDNRGRVFCNMVQKPSDDEDEVAIGVGNTAGWDNAMDVFDNDVSGGGGPVNIGVGNHAGRNNTARVFGNRVLR